MFIHIVHAEEIKRKADHFSDRFNDLASDVQDALEGVNPKKIIIFLSQSDSSLTTQFEHENFLKDLKPEDVFDLFLRLARYWDHFNYHLLEKLVKNIHRTGISKDKSAELKGAMEQYVKEMAEFRQDTAVDVYCDAVIPQEVEVPNDFQEIITKHEIDVGNLRTLQDVENFRKKIAYMFKLNDCLVFIKKYAKGSIILTWWIPKSVKTQRKEFSEADFDEDDTQLKVHNYNLAHITW